MDNVETVVIAWLGSIIDDYAVSGDKPKERPDKFILVDRTGGPRESMVLDRAEILIEVYNKDSRVEASDTANIIADRLRELESYNENLTHARVNSVINLDDIVGEFHRYQVYCDIYLRR